MIKDMQIKIKMRFHHTPINKCSCACFSLGCDNETSM